MIKLCLIGDSHAAALKLGWEIVKSRYPGCSLTVFAAPGDHTGDLRIGGSCLVTDNVKLRKWLKRMSGVRGRIDVDEYDRFLVCGSRFNATYLAGLLVEARIDTEPKDERQPVSSPLFMRMVEARLRAANAILTIEKLRQLTDKPIGLIPKPLRACEDKWVAGQAILGTGTPRRLADSFAAVARMIADSVDCELFGQPEFTKSGPLHTKDEYLKGSTRLHIDNRLQNEDNKAHMNAEYGAAIWHMILADPAWSGEKAPEAVFTASRRDLAPRASLTPRYELPAQTIRAANGAREERPVLVLP